MVWSQSAKLVGIALVRSNRTLGAIPVSQRALGISEQVKRWEEQHAPFTV